MPAAEKSLNRALPPVGIIAGGGFLPHRLAEACEEQGRNVFIAAIDGHADPALTQGRTHVRVRLGATGRTLKALHRAGVRELVFIGSVRRPSLRDLVPDFHTLRFFLRHGLKAQGDDGLLRAVRRLAEDDGFTVRGIQDFATDLLAGAGVMGATAPTPGDRIDISRGVAVARTLGSLDVGQSAIVQEGIVLGVEAAEGTDALIRRCADLKRRGRGGVLVKLCKPGQDTALDLPAIGPETVQAVVESGLAGIAIQAGRTLILDAAEVARRADQARIFVLGLTSDALENIPDSR